MATTPDSIRGNGIHETGRSGAHLPKDAAIGGRTVVRRLGEGKGKAQSRAAPCDTTDNAELNNCGQLILTTLLCGSCDDRSSA